MLCRPFFRQIIFHWHAVGLGEWIEKEASGWERWVTHRLLDHADISIVLSEFGRADAMRLFPRKIDIVPNGIPDPCPDFDQSVLPQKQRRFHERGSGKPTTFTVLFVGACTAAKGLFATLEAIALINKRFLERQILISVLLTVAGEFICAEDRQRFDERIVRSDLQAAAPAETNQSTLVRYAGFVSGDAKNELFRHSDCMCFPSLYAAEGQPVTIIEALAFGLPVVATRWRGIPELVAGAEARIVNDQDPETIANALQELIDTRDSTKNRNVFLERYCLDKHLAALEKAFATIK
jgi:glycosyltransferase involved in cell wall biosynthesis